ncbi:RING finger protein [Merdimmobilis hominis]|uniref:RING finger protein n=1 Tax=Merdimmobilis hominis TaxID=2897707 RepID=UPI00189951E3
MGKYTGIPCAACGRLFEEGDDIVVCPVCGAPHHRECYEKLGHCALEERHALGEAWQPPKGKQGDNPALVICNTCGAQTPADEPFCINCGQRLDLPPRQEQPSPGGSYYIPGVGPIHKNATIGDASMEELAMFVGPNAQFFLPRFQAIHQRKSSFPGTGPLFSSTFSTFFTARCIWSAGF